MSSVVIGMLGTRAKPSCAVGTAAAYGIAPGISSTIIAVQFARYVLQ
jgi:hypothetical protein